MIKKIKNVSELSEEEEVVPFITAALHLSECLIPLICPFLRLVYEMLGRLCL